MRVLQRQRLLDVHVDRERGDLLGQRHEGRTQVDRAAVAQLADGFAHVGQQQPGQGMRLAHVFLRPPLGHVAGHFQVQAEGGQVVAQQVVEFTGDARALVHAGAFGQQHAGGAQLGVETALLLAGLGLLARDVGGDHHEGGKAHVEHGLEQGLPERELVPGHRHEGRHQGHVGRDQPGHGIAQVEQPRQHTGHDHQQDRAQARFGVDAHPDGRGRQHHGQGDVPGQGKPVPTAIQHACRQPVAATEAQVAERRHRDVDGLTVRRRHHDIEDDGDPHQGPGVEAGGAQQAGVAESSQHPGILGGIARAHVPTKVMPGLAHATAGFIRGSPGACPVLRQHAIIRAWLRAALQDPFGVR